MSARARETLTCRRRVLRVVAAEERFWGTLGAEIGHCGCRKRCEIENVDYVPMSLHECVCGGTAAAAFTTACKGDVVVESRA